MIEFGIDEITVVLQVPRFIESKKDLEEWSAEAKLVVNHFVELADFKGIYGHINTQEKIPAGYTNAWTFGEHNFYLAVAYHEYQPRMGIVIKFSATSLDYYCKESQLKVYEFLKLIQSDLYTIRLSRIDLTADYIDEEIDVTDIYNDLMGNRVGVYKEIVKDNDTVYRKIKMKYEGYIKGNEIPTLYLGSVKSDTRLKVYDKKREQLERQGNKLDKALSCNDWTRFEGVFRSKYAHQLSEELLNINTDDEYANLIASTMLQKFRLMRVEEGIVTGDTEYTQMLIDSITMQYFILKAPSNRSYDLSKNITYMFNGSGVMSTFYKVREIWGVDDLESLFNYIQTYLDDYIPNDDCRNWLRRNQRDYQKAHVDFGIFFNDAILDTL